MEERARELHQEHARLVASIDSLRVGLVLLDNDNNVVISNKRTRDILNISEIGSNLRFMAIESALFPAIDIRKFCNEFIEKKVSIETIDIMLGNKSIQIALSPVALPEAPDDVIGIVMLIEDNSDARILKQNNL